ncbi:MAG: hypothetical protein H7Y30_07605 [Pyrinomonadaceae bacterium]|nr:hypothetical protein [Pyrinomonadaceae bacterium]
MKGMLFKLEPFIFNSFYFILLPSSFILALPRCSNTLAVLFGFDTVNDRTPCSRFFLISGEALKSLGLGVCRSLSFKRHASARALLCNL